MARTITPFKLRTELLADTAKHTTAYKKAEGEVKHYTDQLTKEGKRAAKAFDGAGAGARFGKDFGVSAVASIAGSFNVSTLGALIGTAVAPGVGTAIGSAIGGGIDKALSTVTPIVLNTITSGIELNKVIEETRLEFKTLVGSEQEANKYLNELLDISKDIGILPQIVIDTSERLSDLTGDLKLTRSILKAASDQAADFGGGVETFNKIADALGLIAEKGELSSRELNKLYRVGINAKKILAEATGLQEKQIDQLMRQGRLRGDVAARLISEGIEREKGGLAGLKTSQTVAGRERQFGVHMQLRAAEGTQNITRGYGDFLRQANALLDSSQGKQLVAFIDKTAGQVIDWTEKGITAGVSLGGGFAQGLMGGNSLTNLMGSFTKLKDWTGNALNSVFEIKSPSQWSAREVGEPLGEGIGVGLVRRFSGFMQGEGAESIKQTLLSLLVDPKVDALLNTIRTAEGGAMDIMAGGRRVNSGPRHPGEVVPKSQWFKGNRGRSSASGPYQITVTNWRKAEKIFGPLDFSNLEHHKMVALWLMSGRSGGLDVLRSGNPVAMMDHSALDWTSSPGSKIGGGGQWNRAKWLGTYSSFLGGSAPAQITAANPLPVRITSGNGKFLDDLQAGTAANMAAYKRGNDGAAARPYSASAVTDDLGNIYDIPAGEKTQDQVLDWTGDAFGAIVNINSATQDLITTTAQMVPNNALILQTISPVLLGELEIAKRRMSATSDSIAITKEYQAAAREELIVGMSVVDRVQGMLAQVTGMIPSQEVGKKRGLFSKILGFAAPFLSFIPGVGGILSTIAGAAGNIAGGNYGAAVGSIAGGFGTGGVFRSAPRVTTPTVGGTATGGIAGGAVRRAYGGDVYAGRPYLVGDRSDRRPELFVPDENGHVYPPSTRRGGGGDIWERLTRALERMESMSPDDVVRFGARGLSRAMDRDASLAESYGRRLNLGR